MRVWLGCVVALGLLAGRAEAAYIGSPPLLITPSNAAQQIIGSSTLANPSNPVIPLITQNAAAFAIFPTPPYILGKNAILPDVFGRDSVEITDGVLTASLTPPFKGAAASQAALAVSVSPTPSYQCPYTAAFSLTANGTVITNPGGKNIYVCSAALINATAQSVTISEGTGAACGTGPIYWLGAAGGTAALAANGGFVLPAINWAMQKTGDNVCVLLSGSTNVSGTLTYGLY